MAKQKQRIIYNNYDHEQVKAYYRKKQEKKKKRKRRILALGLIVVLIVAFFISDFSKIQTITVTGNEKVSTEEIIAASKIKVHEDFTFFVDLSEAKEAIEDTSLIKSATVSKNLFGDVTIKVVEADPIGQATINGVLHVISQNGRVIKDETGSLVNFVQRCPQISGFDEKRFKEFSSEFAKLPTQVINQISDVHYAPENLVDTRCEFIMDDGKILYVLYDDMASQLANDNYSLIMERFPNQKYYDFCGKYVYAYN